MPILIDPTYEMEILEYQLNRVRILLTQAKAAGVKAIPTTVLEACLQNESPVAVSREVLRVLRSGSP